MALTFPTPNSWLPTSAVAPGTSLLATLGRLPRRVQQAFLLSRLDECSYPQIARSLGCRVAHVEADLISVLEATRGAAGSLEASQWYVHLQSPSITASARIDFRRWLDANPAHLRAFHQTELLWRSLQGVAQAMAANAQHLQGRRRSSLRHWLAGLLALVVLGLLALQ